MQTQRIFSINYQPTSISKIIGHRGARGEVLENTRQGFEHTQTLIQYGLAGIEFDVQLTADGHLVVFHDDTLDRLLRQQGRVEQLPVSFFKNKVLYNSFSNNTFSNNTFSNKVLSSHQVLLLKDMPRLLVNYCHIELEIKTTNRTHRQKLVERLAFELSEFPTNLAIRLTSFDVNILERLQAHAYLSTFPRGLLIEQSEKDSSISCTMSSRQTSQLVDTALRLQCQQVGIMADMITAEVIQSCQRNGLSVTAWTVNNLMRAQWLIDAGVDWIITDYPKAFLTTHSW